MQALRMLFWLTVFSLFVLLLLQNKWMLQEASYLTFYFYNYQTTAIPVPMVISGSMLIGAMLVSLSTLMTQMRMRMQVKKTTQQIKVLEAELAELRNLPINDHHTSYPSASEPIVQEEYEETQENYSSEKEDE